MAKASPVKILSKVAITAWRVYLASQRAQGATNLKVARIVAKGGK